MCILISLLMAVLYVGAAIIIKKELPVSISSMVYILPKGGWRWLWTVWIWLTGFLLIVPLMDALPDGWKFLAFLTIGCLMFCGAMPIFIEENHKWHNIFGIAAGVLSQICVAIINPWYLVLWILILSALWMKNKTTFISEAICFLTLLCCLK